MAKVVVIGAGVVGLSTALLLLQKGLDVLIVAEFWPGDTDVRYTSPLAGAHWRSYADPNDTRQTVMEARTLEKLIRDTHVKDSGVMVVDEYDYWDEVGEGVPEPWFKSLVKGYRHLEERELPQGVAFGITYKAVTVNMPKYLAYLLAQIKALGGKTLRRRLNNLLEATRLPNHATTIIVNCTGLGSKTLQDVQDDKLYPVRGQILIVRAPHVKWSIERYSGGKGGLGSGGMITYVIPRDNGDVILGGTYETHQDQQFVQEHVASHIMQRVIRTRPDIIKDITKPLKVIRQVAGLRPAREGGIRLEQEIRIVDGRRILICHCYGHGGYGVQSSWGSAEAVTEILEEAMQHVAKL